MTLDTWLIYLAACIGLSLTPGPNSLLALTHGALYGPGRTLATIAGGALGFIGVVGVSMFGIASLLTLASELLLVMKIVGGLYLVWLGIQVWRSPAPGGGVGAISGRASPWVMARQGLLSAFANPKAMLFFAAFLPQFIDPAASLWGQFVVMAVTFALVECLTECLIAGFAGRVSGWLTRCGRGFNRTCGGLFMLIGGWLPLSR
ncbi:LysE family translocator [Oceanimonas doudoroffii]|uniref:Lysine transporter LysE n=1 Tax=Oceanimonas doudoroffii TaxID=84158 RepID=A0A233RG01_9GAMM|nr:LysE family translocator [Oceanimonas doudoroffii]OXY82305.1 lysine transporter LysE [Oceanimonas doudoroffii]